LLGRRQEISAINQLLAGVRRAQPATLLVEGAPGIGKSALLDHMRAEAADFAVVHGCGIEAERELAYAGLQQICAPLLGRIDDLPQPQRHALQGVLGLADVSAVDRFLVGLAALSLMAANADERPLLCLVDDAQWIDSASLQTLTFVARRLTVEPIAVVFAARENASRPELARLPVLALSPLGKRDAARLLASTAHGLLDERVRDRIVAEAHGNPLALQELPRVLSPAELAGGFAVPDGGSLTKRIEDAFLRRVDQLPGDTRLMLVLAAAEPVGDVGLLWRAAALLDVSPESAAPAEDLDLVEIGARIRFRHPLVRSAAYSAASLNDRRRVHDALAHATDAATDPDRRAWHRAYAAASPNEDVAAALERSAGRAQARAGVAAAAAFLEKAAALTPDPAGRRARCLIAARAKLSAGAPEAARELLRSARSGPLTELQRASANLLEAEIAFAVNRGGEAAPLLLKAARQLEGLDSVRARDSYLEALSAAMFAGRLATAASSREVAQAARNAPPAPEPPRPADLLLDALAVRFTDGFAAAKVPLQRTVQAFVAGNSLASDELHWLWLACDCAAELMDDAHWDELSARFVTVLRESGALSELPLGLSHRGAFLVSAGRLAEVSSLVDEANAAMEVTGTHLVPYGALLLAAWQGDVASAEQLAEDSMRQALERGEGIGVGVVRSASAVLYNSVGRFADAMAAATAASEVPTDLVASRWGLVELIEAAAHAGNDRLAEQALTQLSASALESGTDWALGVSARCHALLATGAEVEERFRESAERLARTRIRTEEARTHLLFGEWLSRVGRQAQARGRLRTAYDMFIAMGSEAWASRAAAGLRAVGDPVHRAVRRRAVLTPHERRVAQLAADGLSNVDISARLFLSTRTVEWHLGNVFSKLGVTSRHDLPQALKVS
jgi:DNA-binding CsgD family transcriptional regulator